MAAESVLATRRFIRVSNSMMNSETIVKEIRRYHSAKPSIHSEPLGGKIHAEARSVSRMHHTV